MARPRPTITKATPYRFKKGVFAGRTFKTKREYENALAKRKGFESRSAQQRLRPAATSKKAVLGLSRSERQSRDRALAAVARARRENISLSRAARLEHTTVNNVRRHGGGAIETEGKRYRVRDADRLVRPMKIVTSGRVIVVWVQGSRKATTIAQHWRAINRYLNTGDDGDLRGFYGVTVEGYELEADPDVLDYMQSIGELDDVEDIYEDPETAAAA